MCVRTPAAEAAGRWTPLRARWFVGNARRDHRHRAEWFSQVGLRKTVEQGHVNRRRHPNRMTRGAVATFMKCGGRVVLVALGAVMVCAMVTARIHSMMFSALVRGMVVLGVIVHGARACLLR